MKAIVMTAWMYHLNYLLFSAINASDEASDISIAAARFAAQWLVFAAVAIACGLWVWGAPTKRGGLLATGIGVLLGLALNYAIALFWFHPRPFMVGIGRSLVPHAPESSFPSDHVTFLWSLALGLIATGSWRSFGWLIAFFGLVVAWARIYLGLHFPFDMAGSFLVALIAAAGALCLRGNVQRWLLPPAEALYERLLRWLRLSPAAFPRRISS